MTSKPNTGPLKVAGKLITDTITDYPLFVFHSLRAHMHNFVKFGRKFIQRIVDTQKGRPHPSKEFRKDRAMRLYKVFQHVEHKSSGLKPFVKHACLLRISPNMPQRDPVSPWRCSDELKVGMKTKQARRFQRLEQRQKMRMAMRTKKSVRKRHVWRFHPCWIT